MQHKASKSLKKINDRKNAGLIFLIFLALLVGLFFIGVVKDSLGLEEKKILLGATFSKKYAENLGLSWKKAYSATLDELGVKRLRLPAYWDFIEPEHGKFNFDDLDWQISKASERNVKIILAIGRKLPRWPECHVPSWTHGMQESAVQADVLSMLNVVVKHYAAEPSIVAWQVENEPFFNFGVCPPLDRNFLEREVATVRAMDKRPIIITESGELSSWLAPIGLADVIGISTYRIVWNKYIGYFYWPITPKYYTQRSSIVASLVDGLIITELQAEPWATTSITTIPINEQLKMMNPAILGDNIRFSSKIGFPEVYLWGIEWWYWLKTKGHPELWNAGIGFFYRS